MGTMPWLLLAVRLSLLSAVQAKEESLVIATTAENLLGKWYISRWAGTIPFPKKKRHEPLPPFTFVTNFNGKLEFRMHLLKPSGCHLFKLPLSKILYTPGSFASWWRHPIYIWLITPGRHGIAYFEDKMNNQKMQMMMLFGRTLDEDPDAITIFEMLVENRGLNITEIIIPPHIDACELPKDS